MQRTTQVQSISPDTAALLLVALALALAGWRPAAAAPAAPAAPVKRPEPTRPRPTNAPTRKRATRTLQAVTA